VELAYNTFRDWATKRRSFPHAGAFGSFGALPCGCFRRSPSSCVLASVGLFGLVALDVVQRQREFSIRLAVGAQPADVLRLALFRAGGSALVGIMGRVFIALLGTRSLRGMLFQVSPLDLTTYSVVVGGILIVVGLASYLPARRATAVDPLKLLRSG